MLPAFRSTVSPVSFTGKLKDNMRALADKKQEKARAFSCFSAKVEKTVPI
jgi:hypothetical protein